MRNIDKSTANKLRCELPHFAMLFITLKTQAEATVHFRLFSAAKEKRRKKKGGGGGGVGERACYFLADTELHRQDREKRQGADR